MKHKQLTIHEKWELDIKDYKKMGGMLVSTPQCKQCLFWNNKNIRHCEKYEKEDKPDYIIFAEKECKYFISDNDLAININNELDNKVKGAIYGAAVGDALGVPVEFTDRKERKKDPVKEMRAYGTYHQHFGTWSDDSSMLLCLVEVINEGYDLNNLADKFRRFANEAYMTPYDKVFDIGNATINAIKNISAGVEPVKCGGSSEYDNGNGSLMRILPLAFYIKICLRRHRLGLLKRYHQ